MVKSGKNWEKVTKSGENWEKVGKSGEKLGKVGKSLSIAFLAISDQYATFIFLVNFFTKRPFWMTENHFRSHFSLFQIDM